MFKRLLRLFRRAPAVAPPAPVERVTESQDREDGPGGLTGRRTWNPDATVAGATLAPNERLLLRRLEQRVADGGFELPQLQSTVLEIVSLAANPKASMDEIVVVVERDPALSSEVLKTANSVMYAGHVQSESLRDAVVRLGMRGVRSIVLTISMRSAILSDRALASYATEIWRQALSVGQISRHLARAAKMDPEHAYLMGLTHDIGKVALLALLTKETRNVGRLSGTFLGTLFVRNHEAVGSAMAREWHLPQEVTSIAGCHHAFSSNVQYPREAALVSLAHRIDLFASQNMGQEYRRLARAREFEVLGISPADRFRLLNTALSSFENADEMVREAA